MLKLIYDLKCGFKKLYMTEKNCEYDLSFLTNPEYIPNKDCYVPTEEELFKTLKGLDAAELEEYLSDSGTLSCIEEATVEEYGHTYFKHICFEDKDHPYLPGYFKMYNLRLVRTDEEPEQIKKKHEDYLKAEDVMTILGISRQTLSNWVKHGLIETKKTVTGRYVYDAESVYRLKEGSY